MERYPEDDIQLPDNPYIPVDMPDIAWFKNALFVGYRDFRELQLPRDVNASIPNWVTLELRRAYYCALSWADYQLGRVLDELNRVGLADNTIVVFLSDHGYQLGEHGLWTKFTNFELALRTPMMIHIPGVTETMIKTNQLVEFVDLYPSLVEAAGLKELPLCPEDSSEIEICREGVSFLPLIEKPEVPIRRGAFSQAKRTRGGDSIMGYSVRTTRYRYTLWVPFRKRKYKPVWEKHVGEELYDHFIDPEENYNVAESVEYRSAADKMRRLLRGGWRSALYPDNLTSEERFLLDLEMTYGISGRMTSFW